MADILVESTDPELLEQCAKQFFYLMFGEVSSFFLSWFCVVV